MTGTPQRPTGTTPRPAAKGEEPHRDAAGTLESQHCRGDGSANGLTDGPDRMW